MAVLLVLLLAPVKLPGTLDLGNVKDPVSGKKVTEFFVDWKGIRVHFESAKTTAAAPRCRTAKAGSRAMAPMRGATCTAARPPRMPPRQPKAPARATTPLAV